MDLLHRIRWGNVARAAALVTAVGLILAWPSLRSDPPALPPEPALASPRSGPGEFALERPAHDLPESRARERRGAARPAKGEERARRPPRRHRPARRRRPAHRHRPSRHPRTPSHVEAHRGAPEPPAYPPAPAQTEFGFE